MTERPEDLETVMKGFVHMQGCHFCVVGPSLDARPPLSRSTSSYAALNPLARLASVMSSDKSPQLATSATLTPDVVGEVPPREGSGPVPRKMSRGEPGSLASEIGRKGASTVHAEHVLVTRLVQTFVQRGFKYVSRLDGGFRELEKRIRCMDTFAQEQLLRSSPVPASAACQERAFTEAAAMSSTGGFNLLAKVGLTRSNVVFHDDEPHRSPLDKASTSTGTLLLRDRPRRVVQDVPDETKSSRILTTTSTAAISTLSQRLLHLRAAAKDVVSLRASSMPGLECRAAANNQEEDGWVRVYDKESKGEGTIIDVEIQAGPMGISFRKAGTTSSKYFVAVDSLVPGSQAAATGLIHPGDVLVAINGQSVAEKKFLSVIKLMMGSPRPVTLRFLTPRGSETITSMPPLAPQLVSATRHSICIAWTNVSSSALVSYQLQYSKQCGDDDFHVWLPVAMKEEGTKTGVDFSGVTGHTNGTMVGLEPGECVVFRVRRGVQDHWGPYSPSSCPMSTLAVRTVHPPPASSTVGGSSTVASTPMSLEELGAAMFLPGVCPDYLERGRFRYRVVRDSHALRRPTLNAEELDRRLTKGHVVTASERLVCPGAGHVFVRLCLESTKDGEEAATDRSEIVLVREAQRDVADATDSAWALETTRQGDVGLKRLDAAAWDASTENREPARPGLHLCLGAHDASAPRSVLRATGARPSASPYPPRIVEVFPVSSSEIVVTWESVDPVDGTTYQLQYMKDRVAAMWWTVKPDLDATTRSFGVTGLLANTRYVFRLRCRTNETTWSLYSEASTSCWTLPGGIVSIRGEHDGEILSASRSKPASLQATLRTTAVAAASRLKRRLPSGRHASVDRSSRLETDACPDDVTCPASRHVHLMEWKASSRAAHRDFRFYHVTQFQAPDDDEHDDDDDDLRALRRLGHRELVVTPSLLIVLNVLTAPREGYAHVEEWRPLSTLARVDAREDVDDSLVFHFKKKRLSDEEGTDASERLIFVVEGSQACARLVQQYQAKAMDVS
ncbi:hypothetical protein PsorP6_014057 [Peronosclerospora sorghi]|uniref:Uncharacterized protein n=1 Tax=Peronosclerospora sorghi TaxID=230839 RepID=A0ACC0VK79_9STRA|nr:hypothetical protein PsorP6_014057 [Peronosclerospora sorghi]